MTTMRGASGRAVVVRILGLSALLAVVSTAPAWAGPILSPVAATARATLAGSINRTIDQSGLSAGFVSGVTDFDAYIAGNPTHAGPFDGNAWSASTASLPINLDFSLGGSYAVGDLALWTSFAGFSINRFIVFTSADASFATAFNAGSFDANDTLPPMAAQVFNLLPSTGAFLRIQIQSNEGAGAVNLSEIGVEVNAVPEPAGLLLVGAGIAATAARRRLRVRA
jgi:hypothetical protein